MNVLVTVYLPMVFLSILQKFYDKSCPFVLSTNLQDRHLWWVQKIASIFHRVFKFSGDYCSLEIICPEA